METDSPVAAVLAARYIGMGLDDHQTTQLARFHDFLAGEAIKTGGIGPNEGGRLWNRHIADSVVFGAGLGRAEDCLDVGTGVGLPGIPLAILFPDVHFTLVDRAGRRVTLARRACATLGLANCDVVQSDVKNIDERYDFIVSRASLPPSDLMIHVKRLLRVPGVAMIALSRVASHYLEPVEQISGLRASVVQVPDGVLDTTVSLLRIETTT